MFRFDEVWLQNGDECGEVVAETWSASADGLQQKLAEVGVALGSWGMEKFGNIPKKVEETRVILQDLQRRDHTPQVGDQIQRAEAELDSLLEQEEIMWSQRSRATWLKHRDRNTRVFHQKSSQRRRRNLIEEIKDDDGRTWVDDADIGRVLTGYFKDLFSTSGPTEIEEATSLVAGRLTQGHLAILNAPFTREEVEDALFVMHPTKAPGLDGLPALFFSEMLAYHWRRCGTFLPSGLAWRALTRYYQSNSSGFDSKD